MPYACLNSFQQIEGNPMKSLPFLSLFSLITFFGCENSSESHHGEGGSKHVHIAPHGGDLVEVGEHGSGFNLELLLHPDGFLQIYVLDAHAENFVRIPAPSILITIPGENNSTTIECEPIEDQATGETIGNTSLFTSTTRITDYLPLKGVIEELQILEFTYPNVEISFTGKAKDNPNEN
jgi:hypothetical protein